MGVGEFMGQIFRPVGGGGGRSQDCVLGLWLRGVEGALLERRYRLMKDEVTMKEKGPG